MNKIVEKDMKESTKAFIEHISNRIINIIGGGTITVCENVCAEGFVKKLDTMAGIDAFQITEHGMYGIAIRVLFKKFYPNFTIRYNRQFEIKTECEKRIESINNGSIYPYWTIQGYVINNSFVAASIIKTIDLYSYFYYNFYNDYKKGICKHIINKDLSSSFITIPWEVLGNKVLIIKK